MPETPPRPDVPDEPRETGQETHLPPPRRSHSETKVAYDVGLAGEEGGL